jgi:hypothetical protein
MRRTSIFIATIGFALLSLPAQAVTISLSADPLEVQSGGTVSIDIVATDLGDGEFVAERSPASSRELRSCWARSI